MTDIVVVIRQRLLAYADFPPAGLRPGILLAVQRERRREGHGDGLPYRTRVKFCVDIEGECGERVRGRACQTRHTVVFL